MAWLEDTPHDQTSSSVFLQVKLQHLLDNVSSLFLPHLPFSFIPATVGLYHSIKPYSLGAQAIPPALFSKDRVKTLQGK